MRLQKAVSSRIRFKYSQIPIKTFNMLCVMAIHVPGYLSSVKISLGICLCYMLISPSKVLYLVQNDYFPIFNLF